MCGISGLISYESNRSKLDLESSLHKMNKAMLHRGPDSAGVWLDVEQGVALGHQRLAIIDLSEAGHQPMASHDSRYMVVFNGEIYNFPAIRAMLDKSFKIDWQGHSDTEVLLESIVCFGLEETLRQLQGMFALALYDREEQSLTLVRDRMGEKPLYYGVFDSQLVFGSSLASFEALEDIPLVVDRKSVALMMRHNYIPAPYSIYKNVRKVVPGTMLHFQLKAGDKSFAKPQESTYWSLQSDAIAQRDKKEPASVVGLEQLLGEVINDCMVSDVPIGSFLSGGVDSSLITALMQSHSAKPINTFSIGFTEDSFSEAVYAKQVAEHLGTHHTELYLSGQHALDVVPELPHIYDEPFSDSSQIPTFLVSKMAKEHVTVALSGDGGDELFCGYNRYLFADQLRKKLGWLHPSLRGVAAKAMRTPSIDQWNGVYATAMKVARKNPGYKNIGDKIYKASEVIEVDSDRELYRRLVSHWKSPADLVLGSHEYPTQLDGDAAEGLGFIESMMALDTLSYLPDDILVKVDRAAMYNSLETRVPFLNHRVVEYAWQMSLDQKLNGSRGKVPLKEILYKYVPRKLIDRPKMGFGVPMAHWLRNDLKEWADELLSPAKLDQQGVFNTELVQRYWQAHLSGQSNYQYYLWDVLMFQAWAAEREGRISF